MDANSSIPSIVESPLWTFEPSIAELSYPDVPALQQREDQWRDKLGQIVWPWHSRPEEAVDLDVEQLRPPDEMPEAVQTFFERYLPSLEDWSDVNSAWLDELFAILCAPKQQPKTPRHTIFIRRPYSPLDKIVENKARAAQFSILREPSRQDLMDENLSWLTDRKKNDNPLVACVNLERFFINSFAGLTSMRRMIEWLATTEKTCVFVCSSWTFYFLMNAVPLASVMSEPIFLTPFDSARLRKWLWQISDERGLSYAFVEANNERKEIVTSEDYDGKGEETPSKLLDHIVNYTRGNPGIAWKMWRANILGGSKNTGDINGLTLHVRDWKTSSRLLPRVRSEVDSPICAVILYYLLLHDGLPDWALAKTMPFRLSQIAGSLNRLSRRPAITLNGEEQEVKVLSGLVERDSENVWRVSELGYRNVTNYLRSQRFSIPKLVY